MISFHPFVIRFEMDDNTVEAIKHINYSNYNCPVCEKNCPVCEKTNCFDWYHNYTILNINYSNCYDCNDAKCKLNCVYVTYVEDEK